MTMVLLSHLDATSTLAGATLRHHNPPMASSLSQSAKLFLVLGAVFALVAVRPV